MVNSTDDKSKKPMPLEGVKVVEYGVFHAGPGASAILGDLGAEIIKIENGIGDPERYWTTLGGLDVSKPDGESIWFEISNRNKKGIQLDIKKKKGLEILYSLVKEADIFMTNLRKSTKKKLKIDYPVISRINPNIIHANVSGFGPEGPFSDHGAFDPLGQSRSGMMYTTGSDDPALVNLGILDQSTAIAASHGVITALYNRERRGIGQEIHVSLYSAALWMMYANMVILGGLSIEPNLNWSRSKNSPLRNRFCCKDGKWIMGTHHPEEKYWPVFCKITGKPDLLSDPKFKDNAGRVANCPELVEIYDEVFATRTQEEWMKIFQENGMMFSPVYRNSDVLNDEQALVNNYLVDFEHPLLGQMKIPGYPIHFSENSAGIQSSAPNLGEHTDQVLGQIGFTDEEIREFREDGVIP